MHHVRAVLLAMICGLAFPPGASGASDESAAAVARQLNQAFVDVAERVSPSVVIINVVQKVIPASPDDSQEGDPYDSLPPGFWRRFHKEFERLAPAQGSGVIVRENGYILTNRHVVEQAEKIEVRLKDGRTFKATVRGYDRQSDLAVIKIEAEGLAAARFADSTRTRVGEFAIAIGAPFSLDYSVTFGHVSAKGRSNVVPVFEGGALMDQDFLQTDASINPGNSGGPLVNLDGEVIGINTLIRGLQTGIGFAVPSNLAREVADQLIEHGKFARPWLGVEIRALRDDPDLLELLKGVTDGVVVARILPDGPAAKSDLKPSDVIVAVEGRKVSTPQDLRSEIRGRKIGEAVALAVVRDGKAMDLTVAPGEWTEPAVMVASRAAPATSPNPASPKLGLEVQALTADLIRRLDHKVSEGVLVAAVERGGLAARRGIKPGDVITSVDQKAVADPKQFEEAVRKADLQRGLLVNLVSGGSARFEVLKSSAE